MPGKYVTGYKLFFKDQGSWNSGSYYYVGDFVYYNFTYYLCIGNVLNLPPQTPNVATSNWVTISNPFATSDLGDSSLISATSVRGRTIDGLIEKEYLINYYPGLIPNYTQSGLFGVGYNFYGNLGDNTTTNRSSLVQTIAGSNNWKEVAICENVTAAVKTDGSMWTWGQGFYGTLGDNTQTDKSSPVQVIGASRDWKSVSGRQLFFGAIKTDGTLWMWGTNDYGQLGTNSSTASNVGLSSPVQTIAGGNNWKMVSAGVNHTAAVKLDGSLWTWGRNLYGELGDNTQTNRSSPVQTVSAGNNWAFASAGGYTTAGIKTDGTLWMWGENSSNGKLGINNSFVSYYPSPVQTVAGGNNWKKVSIAGNFVAAVKTDGTLWTWGVNTYGQLGTNNTTSRSSPVQTISSGTDWRDVAANVFHTVGLKMDGTIWTWGRNSWGELGHGSPFDQYSPAQPTGSGTGWRAIGSGSGQRTMAIRDFSDF